MNYLTLTLTLWQRVMSQGQGKIKVLCEQTRELTHDFLDYF